MDGFFTYQKREKILSAQRELEGAKPASNWICRPKKPAKQAFGEQSEDFCGGVAGTKVTAALGCQKSQADFFDNLRSRPVGRLLF
ncbi:MAG: hypothetical protein HDT20_00820 [Oscillibacter sp.]|nr:hypothetical protein [Oscillibacter sp.]